VFTTIVVYVRHAKCSALLFACHSNKSFLTTAMDATVDLFNQLVEEVAAKQ